MTPITDRPIRLGVLISSGGTTLANFVERIDAGDLNAEVAVVIASRSNCGGIEKAEAADIACNVLRPQDFADEQSFSSAVFERCREAQVDLVTFAGFLSRVMIPEDFRNRVMNIHPSLIPAFAGQGMYGHHVHDAVLERGCKVSGCTVHFADNQYDHGPIILQKCVPVLDDDTTNSLAARVFAAECDAYPEAIQLFASGRLNIVDGHVVRSE